MPMLNSKFMTSSTGKQITTIHMLPNISISKGQPDYEIWSVNTTEIFFLKNHTENVDENLVPDPSQKIRN